MLETYQGLPAWIHPQPVSILLVKEEAADYALEIQRHLQLNGVTALIESDDDSLSRKIKLCHAKAVPYVFLVGAREKQQRCITVRAGKVGSSFALKWLELPDWIARELRVTNR